MKPANLSKRELKKFGITCIDTKPSFGGQLEQSIWPKLVCNLCGESWQLPMVLSGKSLPDGYWICPKGCNRPQTSRLDAAKKAKKGGAK